MREYVSDVLSADDHDAFRVIDSWRACRLEVELLGGTWTSTFISHPSWFGGLVRVPRLSHEGRAGSSPLVLGRRSLWSVPRRILASTALGMETTPRWKTECRKQKGPTVLFKESSSEKSPFP
jgi:hypothetical protein